jgi:parvulin-like peptidyl-prolyl isomerase
MYQTEEKKPVQGVAGSVVTPNAEASKKKMIKMFAIGFGGLLALVLVVSLGIGIYRVYAKADTDSFAVGIAKAFRLPVAKVNGSTILYSDYADDLKAIKVMRDYDKQNSGSAAGLSDTELSDQVLLRQVTNIIIDSLARENSVAVEKSDIDSVKQDILVKQFGSLDSAEKAIKERYGWTLPQFEDKVIKQFVLQNKLAEKVSANEAAREQIRQQAQTVLDKIKNGADFGQMAQQYGQDGTASRGGDLGWFSKGEMVPEFETAAFALKKGELSPNLVETQFGYHIIMVDDKKTEKTKDANGKTVNKESVKARHILFAFPSLNKILSDDVKNAQIHIYGSIHDPFPAIRNASSTNQ